MVASEADSFRVTALTLGQAEAACRDELQHTDLIVFYVLAASVSILSVAFLAVSIVVFCFIQKKLLREMNETIYKAHDVMDAVMVALIPTALLDVIGVNDGKKRSKTKEE